MPRIQFAETYLDNWMSEFRSLSKHQKRLMGQISKSVSKVIEATDAVLDDETAFDAERSNSGLQARQTKSLENSTMKMREFIGEFGSVRKFIQVTKRMQTLHDILRRIEKRRAVFALRGASLRVLWNCVRFVVQFTSFLIGYEIGLSFTDEIGFPPFGAGLVTFVVELLVLDRVFSSWIRSSLWKENERILLEMKKALKETRETKAQFSDIVHALPELSTLIVKVGSADCT